MRKRTRGRRLRLPPCFAIHCNGTVTPPRKEVFNAVQAAAAQSAEDTVIDMLQQFSTATEVVGREQSSLARVKPTALTERATTIMKQTVWKYQHHRKAVSTDKLYYVPMAQNTRRIVFTSTNTK